MRSPETLHGCPNKTQSDQKRTKYAFSNQTQPSFDFIIVHAIWFDILASVTTGRVPRIMYRRWLQESKLEMADLMGYYNRVMIAIGDLAHVHAWKTKMTEQGTLSMPRLVMRNRKIDARLRNGIKRVGKRNWSVYKMKHGQSLLPAQAD
jgi:hypothetical protein